MTISKRNIQISVPKTGADEWEALREPLSTGWLTQGPKVAQFEKLFAERHRVKHAIATTSATTALHVILAALGIGPGDEVIVPSFTWVASANAVEYCGAHPVLIDVDPVTFNIDPALVSRCVTSRTKAIVAVHLFGLCADMHTLRQELPSHVKIIEDAACAAGAHDGERPAGGLADAAAFSFHPRKSITTGEGGMVTTNSDTLAGAVRTLRNHGASPVPADRQGPHVLGEFDVIGYNYRMTDVQAAVGIVQLGKLDAFIDERQHWAAYYRQQLASLDWLRLPSEPGHGRHAWQAFVTYVDPSLAPMPRNSIMNRLGEQGIATRPGTHAVHMLGVYRDKYGFDADAFPASRDCYLNSMAIPLHNCMVHDDYEYVVSCLRGLS